MINNQELINETINNQEAMEEDIKVLEEFIKEDYNCKYTLYEVKKSTENLIKELRKIKTENVKMRFQDIPLIEDNFKIYKDRVKELKEIEKAHQKENGELRERVKELEEENEELKIITNGIKVLETNCANDDTYYVIAKRNFLSGSYKKLLDDYISKSAIKEKIEELEKRYTEHCYFTYTKKEVLDICITELKELLGKEDK